MQRLEKRRRAIRQMKCSGPAGLPKRRVGPAPDENGSLGLGTEILRVVARLRVHGGGGCTVRGWVGKSHVPKCRAGLIFF